MDDEHERRIRELDRLLIAAATVPGRDGFAFHADIQLASPIHANSQIIVGSLDGTSVGVFLRAVTAGRIGMGPYHVVIGIYPNQHVPRRIIIPG